MSRARSVIGPWIATGCLALAACVEPVEHDAGNEVGEETALADLPLGEGAHAIIGGRDAMASELPTVVALMFSGSVCSGTLIHPEWVVTAAHCLKGLSVNRLRVSFDDADVNDGTTRVVDAAQILAHPDYNSLFWDNDIGLVKLATKMTDRAPTPIRRNGIPAGTEVLQAGFGDSSDRRGQDGVLRKLATKTVDCAEIGSTQYRGDRLLCFSSADGDGTCDGDSGGPTFVKVGGKRYLVGLTSGGTDDSCRRGYDLSTLLPAEMDFLTTNIPGLMADEAGNGTPEPNDPADLPPTRSSDGEAAGCSAAGGASGAGRAGGPSALLLGLALLWRRRRPKRAKKK